MKMLTLDRNAGRDHHIHIFLEALGACHGLRFTLGDVACKSGSSKSDDGGATTFAILGDLHDKESSCTCYVLETYLQHILNMAIEFVQEPYKLQNTECLLVVLTNGVLESLDFAEALVVASQSGVSLLPVRADDNFLYPDTEFYDALHKGSHIGLEDMKSRNINSDLVEAAYHKLFNMLALKFSPHASEIVQKLEARIIAERLEDLRNLCKTGSSQKSGDEDGFMSF